MSQHTVAFDQIRLLIQQVEDLFIERNFYRSKLDEFISAEEIDNGLREYNADSAVRQSVREYFRPVRDGLESLAQSFVTEELSKNPPPSGPTN